jgi:hypothetical protein
MDKDIHQLAYVSSKLAVFAAPVDPGALFPEKTRGEILVTLYLLRVQTFLKFKKCRAKSMASHNQSFDTLLTHVSFRMVLVIIIF